MPRRFLGVILAASLGAAAHAFPVGPGQPPKPTASPTEFTVLEYLMRFAGQVVTRKMLSQHVWDDDWDGTTNVIDVHINRLRNKIDRGFDVPLIQTVRGHGYVLRAAEPSTL